MDKVSILIPVYNGEKTIKKCILSCINQSYKDIEIIVWNDGSSDNTLDILNNYDIKIYSNKKNMGLGYTRNRLIKKCRSKYFMFLDSDDYLDRDCILKLVNAMNHYKCDMVMGRINNKYHNIIILDNNNKFDLLFNNIDDRFMIQQNKLFRRSIFNNLEYPNQSFADDEAMIHKVINNCRKIVIIPDQTYYYMEEFGLHNNSLDKYYLSIAAYKERFMFFIGSSYERVSNNSYKNIMIYYYKVFYSKNNNVEMNNIYKEYRTVLLEYKKYIRFRDIIFLCLPKVYCRLRKIGD